MNYYRAYPEYKDSGLKEIGSIPKHWELKRLRYVGRYYNSGVDKKSYDDQTPVLLCNYTDVYKNEIINDDLSFMPATASRKDIEQFTLKAGDVIITKDSEDPKDIGVPAYVPRSIPGIVCGYHLTVIRGVEGNVGGFIHRVIQSSHSKSHFFVNSPGVTRYGLNQTTIGNTPIPLPPVKEQEMISRGVNREIVRIDTLINNKTIFINLLKEKKHALISHTVTKGIPSRETLKPTSISWLKHVPQHWEIVPSVWLFAESKEKAYEDDQHLSATQKYGVIPLSEYERLENRQVTHAVKNLEKRKHVELDDFVISMRSFQGGIERVKARGCVRSSYVVLKASEDTDVDYFAYLFKSSAYIQGLQATSSFIRDGQDLNYGNFRQVKLPKPPLEEQKRIAQYLNQQTARIDALIEKTQHSVALLTERRAAFITAAVTGQIDLRGEE